jgi:anaerobic selenocysteine-containing dehydrogenase
MNPEKDANMKEISRRKFLQGSMGVTAAAILGGKLMPSSKKSLVPGLSPAQTSEGKWIKSYCTSCIWPNCGTEVKVVDGVAMEIRGNKEHPFNQGTLCPRGNALLMNLYNPYRLKAPMKRTNPAKGRDIDPGWVEISWEEAFATVGDRLKKIQQTDPRKFIWGMGFSSNPHEARIALAMNAIFNSPNVLYSNGQLCEVHYAPILFNGVYVDRIDLGYCNYLIDFGRNIGGSAMFASGPGRMLADALERGMKLIVVDPHASPEASKGEWVPIKPGTDLAFAMAMLHLILHEIKQYDAEALKIRTNAPYLIDNAGEYVRDSQSGKPLLWDTTSNIPKTFDDPSLGDVALEGIYDTNGVVATPAFSLLKKSVADSTPEWAEKLTGIPATKIREITQRFVEESQIGATIIIDGIEYPYRPAAITAGRGSVNTLQGKKFYVLVDTINAVMGGMGVPGSILTDPPLVAGEVDGVLVGTPINQAPDEFTIPQNTYNMMQFYPNGVFPPTGSQYGAILDPQKYYLDYEIDTFFFYGWNALINDGDPEIVEKALAKIPFSFTVAYHIDEAAYFADILFPESAQYERYQARVIGDNTAVGKETIALGGIHAKVPVLDKPLYDTKQMEEIVIELADRAGTLPVFNAVFGALNGFAPDKGLEPMKKYTAEELVDIRLKNFTGDPTKGLDYFKEKGFFIQNLPMTQCYEYATLKEAKIRLPIYDYVAMQRGKKLRDNLDKFNVTVPGWDDLTEVWLDYEPLVTWHDNWLTAHRDDYDLYAINWKISPRNIGIGGQDDNAFLREIVENWEFDDLHIQINSATARSKGLKTGDHVLVESLHGGKVEGVIKTTDLVHPDVIGFPAQAGRWSKYMNPRTWQGSNYNLLLTMKEGWILSDGPMVNAAPVKVSKI